VLPQIYMDDVIIYSKTVEEHMTYFEEVLGLLRSAGAFLKLRKCHFFQTKVNYLGHAICPGRLAVAQKSIDTVEKAIYPTKRTELRSFLGMCNVYIRFVEAFAKIAAPLTDFLKKGQPETFVLTTE
jgi:Reverse transcriptase (RNA-dependent DNA polymerase)